MLEKVNIACKNKQNTNKREQKEREKKIVNEKIGCSVKTSAFDDGFFFLLKQVNNVYWLESNVDTNLLKLLLHKY